jgi:hypothetical protein
MGTSATDIARKPGTAEHTVYRRKERHGRIDPDQDREFRQREQNAKLKWVVADLGLG